MSFITIRDFPQDIDQQLGGELDMIIASYNAGLDLLARETGGAFAYAANEFNRHRRAAVDLLVHIIVQEVLTADRVVNQQFADELTDAAIVLLVDGVAEIKNNGDAISDDRVADIQRGNAVVRSIVEKEQRGRGGYGRQREYGGRHQPQRAGFAAPTGTQLRNRQPAQRQTSQPYQRNAPVAASTQRPAGQRRRPTESAVQEQQVQQGTTIMNTPQQVQPDTVITKENYSQSLGILAPAYIIGAEQVIFDGSKLVVKLIEEGDDVDYAKHSIDRFYKNLLGDEVTDLIAVTAATQQATEFRNNVIASYVQEEGKEEIPFNKLFDISTSGEYDKTLNHIGFSFDPIDIRNTLIEQHNGSVGWFSNNALLVRVDHHLPILEASNDNLEALKAMFETQSVQVLLQTFIGLYAKVESSLWLIIHDYLTHMFNTRLIRDSVPVQIDTITGSWADFCEYVKTENPTIASIQNSTRALHSGLSLSSFEQIEDDVTTKHNTLVIQRVMLYLPVSSSELTFGSATPNETSRVLPNSAIHMIATKLFEDDIESTVPRYVITLDGKTIEFNNVSSIIERSYTVRVL